MTYHVEDFAAEAYKAYDEGHATIAVKTLLKALDEMATYDFGGDTSSLVARTAAHLIRQLGEDSGTFDLDNAETDIV